MLHRTAYLYALRQRIGYRYLWGGSGPDAFDCSGVVIASLNDSGLAISDTNAQGLYILFQHNPVERLQAPPGSLYFYGDGVNAITHVMTVIEHWDGAGIVLAGARGGDHTTTTPEIAAQQKAFVDTVWGDYWLDKFVAAVDPFAGESS